VKVVREHLDLLSLYEAKALVDEWEAYGYISRQYKFSAFEKGENS
jgi:ribosomal protein L7/L12